MSRVISLVVLSIIILVIVVLFFRVMSSFLLPLFLAAVLAVLFKPVHRRLQARFPQRKWVPAALTTAIIMLAVFLPTALVVTLAAFEGVSLASRLDALTLNESLARVRGRLGLDMPLAEPLHEIDASLESMVQEADQPREERREAVEGALARINRLEEELESGDTHLPPVDLAPLRESLQGVADARASSFDVEAAAREAQRRFVAVKQTLLGGPYRAWLKELANPSKEEIRQISQQAYQAAQEALPRYTGRTTAFLAKLVVGVIITIVAVYFFLADGPAMIETVLRLSPLDDRYERELVAEFDNVSRAVVLATLLSAAAQGLLAGFGYWLAGLDSIFLLILLTTLLAMVPFVGAPVVWVPICLWLWLYEGRIVAAVLLALYGALVVGMVDNLIKPWVLHGQSKLHPLLALLSVLGGVQALGPIGVLVGPMVVVFLRTLLNILHRELASLDRWKKAQLESG
jgi:predicted PurR-regulated permease PerM